MFYSVDVYTGQSIFEKHFDDLSQVCEFLFEIDVTDYSTINICKYENESKISCDFTGVCVDADGLRTDGKSESSGH